MLLNTLQSSIRCLRCVNVLRPQNLESIITKQKYSGWAHRTPVEVVNEEIVLDSAEEAPGPVPRKYADDQHRPMKPKVRNHPPKKPAPRVESDETYQADGTPNILKFTEDNRKLSSLMMTLKSRKIRDKNNQILLEGHRLIADAIKSGLTPEIIMFSRTPDIMKLTLPKKGVKLYKIPYATLQLWSNLTTSPGIIGIFKYPDSFEKEPTADTLPLTIICDNVREPGNLGTILRAAAGVGCERVILTKGCVDVWESKVLRSAAGAHFRVSISKSVEWQDVKSLISPDAKIFAADSDASVKYHDKTDSPTAETHSDSEENLNDETSVECRSTDGESKDESENSSERRKVTAKELSVRIPVIPYYAAEYSTSEVVLIVGGETEGLSYESLELVKETGGVRVNVPLTNDVESLNTGMALGILAFEVKRQFALRKGSIIK